MFPILEKLTPGGVGIWVLVAMLAGVWPKLRQIQSNSDSSLREDLLAELKRLRDEALTERNLCDAKIAAIEARHDKQVADMKREIDGLRSQILQINQSALGVSTPITSTLQRAYPLIRELDKD